MVSIGEEGYVIKEVRFEEWAYKPRNAKNYWQPPGARRGKERFLSRTLEEACLRGHLDFGFLASRPVVLCISIVFKAPSLW